MARPSVDAKDYEDGHDFGPNRGRTRIGRYSERVSNVSLAIIIDRKGLYATVL